MARNNNGSPPRNAGRQSASGRVVAKNPSKTTRATSRKDTATKADKMFQRAWKDTYEKRDRRVD